jgi:hypothetical protein
MVSRALRKPNPPAVAFANIGAALDCPSGIVGVAAALFLATAVVWFPGILNYDSNQQYLEAVSRKFYDWHPPVMAWVWSYLRRIKEGSGPLFLLQAFLYWFGLGLIALSMHRQGYRRTAWGILAIGVFPPFVSGAVRVMKDTGLATVFLASFAILFHYRTCGKKPPWYALAVVSVLLLYGILVRANGIFGGAPLILYMLRPKYMARPWRYFPLALLVVALSFPLSGILNHKVIGATNLEVHRTLQIFDVAGIAYYAHDPNVFDPPVFSEEFIARCYTPMMWDTLGASGDCKAIWKQPYPHWTGMWLKAILHHPIAYLEHRLAHFNDELGFIEPRHYNTGEVKESLKLGKPPAFVPFTPSQKILDIVLFNPLTVPALFIAIGVALLTVLYRKKPTPLGQGSLAVLLSGLLYCAAFLVIGVASEYRYQFWPMLAIAVAFVLSLPEHGRRLRHPGRADWIRIGAVAAVLAVVVISQIVLGDALYPGG